MARKIPTVGEVLADIKVKFPEPSSQSVFGQVSKDPDFFDTVMRWVAGGGTVANFARATHLDKASLYRWLNRLEGEERERYQEAKELAAAARVDSLEDLDQEVREGKITPAAAKQISDNKRWVAARQDPKTWGDHSKVDVNVNSVIEMHLAGVKELAEGKRHERIIEGKASRLENSEEAECLAKLLE